MLCSAPAPPRAGRHAATEAQGANLCLWPFHCLAGAAAPQQPHRLWACRRCTRPCGAASGPRKHYFFRFHKYRGGGSLDKRHIPQAWKRSRERRSTNNQVSALAEGSRFARAQGSRWRRATRQGFSSKARAHPATPPTLPVVAPASCEILALQREAVLPATRAVYLCATPVHAGGLNGERRRCAARRGAHRRW
jgi:hypothetical protein